MRAALRWVLDAVPFDARSRRAIDETLADWDFEHTRATTAKQVHVAVAGVTALLRTVTIALFREGTHVLDGWLATRLLLAVFAPTLLIMAPTVKHFQILQLSSVESLISTFLLFPGAMLLFVPWGVFAATAAPPPGKSVPYAGVAMVAAAGAVGLTVLMPHANQMFREFVAARLSGGTLPSPPRGRNEVSVVGLFETALADPRSYEAMRFLLLISVPILAAGMAVAASVVARLPEGRRRPIVMATPLAFVAWVVIVAVVGAKETGGWSLPAFALTTLVASLLMSGLMQRARPCLIPGPRERQS